jgi:transglutaminase-like putative cysteine protease
VRTSAQDAWQLRKGVCQDIAQLTAGLLRAVGIPARYVSGYLYPRSDAEVGDTVAGQSHAWVEWFTGDWEAFDPTNGTTVGKRHVIVARGRDYADVTPLKGVYHGAPSTDLGVTVEITRLA